MLYVRHERLGNSTLGFKQRISGGHEKKIKERDHEHERAWGENKTGPNLHRDSALKPDGQGE